MLQKHEILVQLSIQSGKIVYKIDEIVVAMHKCQEKVSELRLQGDVLEECLAQQATCEYVQGLQLCGVI